MAGPRHIMGSTNPDTAEVGTIRADFAQVMEFNIVRKFLQVLFLNLRKEIKIYFNDNELFTEGKCMSRTWL